MKFLKFGGLAVLALASMARAEDTPAAVKIEMSKKNSATVVTEKDTTTITIICPSGIGKATMTKTGKGWGNKFIVKFMYAADKPFKTLESATATFAHDGRDEQLMTGTNPKENKMEIDMPVDSSGIDKISMEWVDAHRN